MRVVAVQEIVEAGQVGGVRRRAGVAGLFEIEYARRPDGLEQARGD
jgi:hypothetical protein